MSSKVTRETPKNEGPAGRTRRYAFFAWALAALILLVGAYANFFKNAFHFDDGHVLENNVFIRNIGNIPRFFVDARTFSSLPANSTYRPLVSASLAVDYWIAGGLSPVTFHVSQLIQLLVLWGALAIFYRKVMDLALPGRSNALLALGMATFFAVHVTTTETMNLMHARSEIQSALGILVAFLLFLTSKKARKYLLYLIPVVLGALAKVPAVLFAPLLFIFVLLAVTRWRGTSPLGVKARTKWVRALKSAAPSFILGAVLFVAIDKMGAPGQTYGGGERWSYALTQTWVWVKYLKLFILPTGLTADTDLPLVTGLSDPRAVFGILILGFLLWGILASARHQRTWPIAFGLSWFAIGLLPTSSILPLAEPMNEHRIFLPYMGLTLAAAWLARLLLRRHLAAGQPFLRWAVVLGCLVLICGHALGTRVRNTAWKTGESLWRDVTEKSPGNGRGWMNYGLALMGRGDYDGARKSFEMTQRLLPNYSYLEINMGILEGARGNNAKADQHFKRALQLDPGLPASYVFYGRWLVPQGRAAEAVPLLQEAARLSPADGFAPGLLMDLLAAQGDLDGAAAAARKVLENLPRENRARIYAEKRIPLAAGDNSARALFEFGARSSLEQSHLNAALAYQAALLAGPATPETLNNLGWTLGQLGFRDAGRRYLLQALEMRPGWEQARNNLALLEASRAAAPPGTR